MKLCTGCYNRVSHIYMVVIDFPFDPMEEELCQGCIKGVKKRIKDYLRERKHIQ